MRPMSKTSPAIAAPAARSGRNSSNALSTMCPGRISTSRASPGRKRIPRPCRRARPRSACGCSTASSPNITKRRHPERDRRGRSKARAVAKPVAEIGFYHLLTTPLERALPRLLERARAQGYRIVVRAASADRIEHLNAALWTYDEASFLPHGSARDGNAASQPIWLTDGDDNPNAATMLVLVDGAEPGDLTQYARIADLFDGGDADAVSAARDRWRRAKSAGHTLTYWQQTGAGWEKKG